METAYFKGIGTQLVSRINAANSSIDIAMAWFTNYELFSSLIEAIKRGISVRLVLQNHPTNFMLYAPDFNELIEAGGQLWLDQREQGMLHHKFCVIDHQYVFTGSYNWTYAAENLNIENVLLTSNQDIVSAYDQEFTRLIKNNGTVDHAPRLSFEEIQEMDQLDLSELNSEIKHIAQKNQMPTCTLLKSQAQVQFVNVSLKPVAKTTIGILVDGNQKTGFIRILEKGASLPFKSAPLTLYINSEEDEIILRVLTEEEIDTKYNIIKEQRVDSLVNGQKTRNLPVTFQMDAEETGYVHVVITCQKNGRRCEISTINKDLVEYK